MMNLVCRFEFVLVLDEETWPAVIQFTFFGCLHALLNYYFLSQHEIKMSLFPFLLHDAVHILGLYVLSKCNNLPIFKSILK